VFVREYSEDSVNNVQHNNIDNISEKIHRRL